VTRIAGASARVVLGSPNPASQIVYSYRVPEAGARGTITAVRTAGSVRTYIPGPGAGLVYVEWDGDGLVCAVSLRDLKLEPAEEERRR
jgi:hypothetical protein